MDSVQDYNGQLQVVTKLEGRLYYSSASILTIWGVGPIAAALGGIVSFYFTHRAADANISYASAENLSTKTRCKYDHNLACFVPYFRWRKINKSCAALGQKSKPIITTEVLKFTNRMPSAPHEVSAPD